jgi:2-oxoglutarate dehydrogenase E2 component (dihydrolipoamide succinyltransferase)
MEIIKLHTISDISIAVSGPKGLMVPVVRNAENLTFRGVEADIKRLAIKARDGQITVDDMTGGTLLLLMVVFLKYVVYPIINPPQSAIWECTTLLNVQLL